MGRKHTICFNANECFEKCCIDQRHLQCKIIFETDPKFCDDIFVFSNEMQKIVIGHVATKEAGDSLNL